MDLAVNQIVGVLAVSEKLLVVRVTVDFMLEVERYILVCERLYNTCVEFFAGAVLYKLLFFLVKDYHEDVLATKHGQLNSLLDNASLPFGISDISLVLVFKVGDRFLRSFCHLR